MVGLESTSTLTIKPQMWLLLLNKDSVCLYIREYVYTSLPIREGQIYGFMTIAMLSEWEGAS